MPANVTATTSASEAIAGARYAIHAVPVQHSREFLNNIKVKQTSLSALRGILVIHICYVSDTCQLGAVCSTADPLDKALCRHG